MREIPLSFLRKRGETIRNLLAEEGVLVVTSRSRPFAILIDVEEGELEDTVSLASQIRAGLAVARLRKEARTKGLGGFSMEEIAQETREVRRDRRELPEFQSICPR